MLEKLFRLKELGTDIRTEVMAGLVTFMTMAYIIAVNPAILSAAGMPKEGVIFATCFAAAASTLLMGLTTNYPIALASGMGINAYFVMVVADIKDIEDPWKIGLGAVFLSGVIFLLASALNLHKVILKAIPLSLRLAIAAGIGLLIAFLGLHNGGIIHGVVDQGRFVKLALGNVRSPEFLVTLFGILFTAVLMGLKVRGAILWGIVATVVFGVTLGTSFAPERIVALPDASSTFLKLDLVGALKMGFINIILVFFFVDLFDTIGTLVGVGELGGFMTKEGELPKARRALISDALGTILGGITGTSTVTSYIESAAGVSAGGRSGLTSVVVAILFLLSMFFAPVIVAMPEIATAPALVLVGALMMAGVVKILWEDRAEGIPAFLVLITIPATSSIADGLAIGFVSYPIVKACTGKVRDVHPVSWILCLLVLCRYAVIGGH